MARRAGLTLELNNYAQFKRELANLDKTIGSIDRRVDNIGNAFDKMEREAKQARTETKRTADEIDRASKTIKTSTNRLQEAADGFTQVGTALTVGFTAPFLLLKDAGVSAASDFEDALVDMQFRANLTGDEMERIQEKALDIGRDTQFSAKQGADAFLQLLTSGQSVDEAFQTVDSVITGAAASGENLGFVSDALTDVMAAFNLEASESANVLEDLVDASGSSSATVSELVQGFQNVGGVAREFGLSTRETAAVLAIFSENGIKGAEAGTQLRSMLNNMTRDTEDVQKIWNELGISFFNSEGVVRPLNDVMNDLRTELDGMTEENRIKTIKGLAGSFGQLGLSALTSGESIEDMVAKMAETGDAGDIAAAKMQTLSGRFAFLRGSIETLLIKAFTPFNEQNVKPFINSVAEIVNAISEWVDANPELTRQLLQFGSIFAVVGPGLVVFGQSLAVLSGAGAALGIIFSPAVLAVIGGIALAINDIRNNVGGAGDAFNQFKQSVSGLFEALGEAFSAIVELFSVSDSAGVRIERTWSPVTFVFQTLATVIDGITASIQTLTGFTKVLTGSQLSNVLTQLSPVEQNKLIQERARIQETINKLQEDGFINNEGILDILVEQGDTVDSLAEKYGVASEEIERITGGELFAGQSINIPVDVSNLADLRQRISDINQEISDGQLTRMEGFLQGFAQTSAFKQVFGEGEEAIDRARVTMLAFRDVLNNASTIASAFSLALTNIVNGDVQAGLEQLKIPLIDFADSIGDLLNTFSNRNLTQEDLLRLDEDGVAPPQNPLVQAITQMADGLKNFEFAEAKQIIADNIDEIIRGAVSIVGIVLGGPFGAVVGVGNIILAAIRNDFLGIGTKLEESGVLPALRIAMDSLRQAIDAIINGTFGAQSDDIVDNLPLSKLTSGELPQTDPLTGFFDGIISALSSIANDPIIDIAIEVLKSIRDGVVGFSTALFGADPAFIQAALTALGEGLDVIVNAVAVLGGGVIKGFFDTLPALGQALSDMFVGIGNLLDGDTEVGIQKIFDAIAGGITTMGSLPVNVIDSIVTFFNTVTGLEVPTLSEAFDAITTAVDGFINSPEFQSFVNSPLVQTFVSTFTDLASSIQTFAQDIGTIDFSPIGELLAIFGSANVGVALGYFAQLVGLLGGLGIGLISGVLNGIGNALPSIASGIESFVGAFGNLLEGNFGLVFTQALEGLGNFFNALISIPVSIVDKLIEFFNAATGSNFATLSGLGDALKAEFRRMGADIDSFLLNIENALLQLRIEITKVGVATGTATEESLQGLLQRQLELQFEQELVKQVETALDTGDVGVNLPVNLDFNGRTFDNSVIGLLDNPDFVNNLTPGTQNLLQEYFDQLPPDQQTALLEVSAIEFDISNAEIIGPSTTPTAGDSPFLQGGLGDIIPADQEVTTTISSVFGSTFNPAQVALEAYNIGTSVDTGIAQGLNEGTEAELAANNSATAIDQSFRDTFGIYSPSTVMTQYGIFLMQGLSIGMQSMQFLITGIITTMQVTFSTNLATMASNMTLQSNIIAVQSSIMATNFNNSANRMVTSANNIRKALDKVKDELNAIIQAIAQLSELSVNVDGTPVGPSTGTDAQNRYFGGGTQAGRIYEFNERGLPFEIYQTGGRNFMIPNQSGNFVSPANSQSLYTPAPTSGNTTSISNSSNSVQYNVTVNIPDTIQNAQDITPEVIADGMQIYQENNPPEFANQGNL